MSVAIRLSSNWKQVHPQEHGLRLCGILTQSKWMCAATWYNFIELTKRSQIQKDMYCMTLFI